jgi:hypothetical protein
MFWIDVITTPGSYGGTRRGSDMPSSRHSARTVKPHPLMVSIADRIASGSYGPRRAR